MNKFVPCAQHIELEIIIAKQDPIIDTLDRGLTLKVDPLSLHEFAEFNEPSLAGSLLLAKGGRLVVRFPLSIPAYVELEAPRNLNRAVFGSIRPDLMRRVGEGTICVFGAR